MRLFPLCTGLVALTLAGSVRATPHTPYGQIVTRNGSPAAPITTNTQAYTVKDALSRLALIATYEQDQQETGSCPDAAQCDFGGIHEVESGPGHAIVESDNTQQSIWIWSYQHIQDPLQSHPQQITNAFEFLTLYPGWTEWMDGNGTGPDYYSIYNCGWGVRAIIEYEAATGDMSHHSYGVQCAQHIHDYAPGIAKGNNLIDVATAGWGASGLWLWGDATKDAAAQQTASDIGAVIKAWLDGGPSRASMLSWAVTGGTAFDGVVGSYMKQHPSELAPWVAQMAPSLGGWIDESTPASPNDWTDWRNASAGWNMLAQFDAADALTGTDSDAHRAIALDILDKLWMQDDDGDGAIPGSQQRLGTDQDESWVTAYFTVFGLRQVSDGTATPDAGIEPDAGDDAGPQDDAGPTPTPPAAASAGCSCDVARGDGTSWGLLAALAATVLALARRRR